MEKRYTARELRRKGRTSKRAVVLESSGSHAYLQDKKQRNQRIRQRSAFMIDNSGSILGIVVMILLVMAIFAVLVNKEVIDFGGFLSVLQEAPSIDLDWLSLSETSLGDWGSFNFLRDFFGLLLGTVDVVVFIGTALIQVVLYVVYFLRILLL